MTIKLDVPKVETHNSTDVEVVEVKMSFPTSGGLTVLVIWNEGEIVDGTFVPRSSHRGKFDLDSPEVEALSAVVTGGKTVLEALVDAAETMISDAGKVGAGTRTPRAFPKKRGKQ